MKLGRSRWRTFGIALPAGFLAIASSASAAVIPLSDFETAFGAASFDHFNFSVAPGGAGQSQGYNTGTRSSQTSGTFEGRVNTRVVINDTTVGLVSQGGNANQAWSLRLVANNQTADAASPSSWPAATVGNTGYVGFYVKTTAPGLSTAILIDDQTSAITERATITNIVSDGEWHLYEWNLGDANQWFNFNGGNGTIDSAAAMLDSIMFWRSSAFDAAGSATIDLDFVAYNPNGSLNPIPGLFNTGLNHLGAPGTPYQGDAHWTVTRQVNGALPPTNDLGSAASVVNQDGNPIPPWLGNTATSGWISAQYTVNFDDLPGFYDYHLDFDVAAADAALTTILGRWLVDDIGVDIYLNGVATGQTANSQTVWSNFILTGLQPGTNRVTFRVQNGGTAANDIGLRVEFTSVTVAAVPEPASLSLMAVAGAGLMARRARREQL